MVSPALLLTLLLLAKPEYVLLKPGTAFYPPDGIPAGIANADSCCGEAKGMVAVRLLRTEGDRLEVETLGEVPENQDHCGFNADDNGALNYQLASYRLKVWVKRDAVLEVIARPLKQRFEDGTVVRLGAGLPVHTEGPEPTRVRFGLLETAPAFNLLLEEGQLGHSYQPGKPFAERARVNGKDPPCRSADADLWTLSSDTIATLGPEGRLLLIAQQQWPSCAVRFDGKGGALVPVESHCAMLTVRIPADAIERSPRAPQTLMFKRSLCFYDGSLEARAGASVYWPNGAIAGRTSGDQLHPPFQEVLGRRCFDATLQNIGSSLPLCFDPADLKERK
jgi:hypothetical protein